MNLQLMQATNSMSLITKVVPIFFIGVFILAVVTYLRVNAEYRRNMKSPVTTQKAKLISKRVEIKGHKNPDKDPKLNPTARIYHVLRFRLENGELAEYDVEEADYNQMTEGALGKLTTQGTWFKGFESKNQVTRGPDIAKEE